MLILQLTDCECGIRSKYYKYNTSLILEEPLEAYYHFIYFQSNNNKKNTNKQEYINQNCLIKKKFPNTQICYIIMHPSNSRKLSFQICFIIQQIKTTPS